MRKNKKVNLIFIIAIVILLLVFGYSLAKYVILNTSLHIQTAEKFYFNSSVLKESNPQYVHKDWDGNSEYILKIDLNNFEDSFRHTKEDTIYEFSANCQNEFITITTSLDGNNQATLEGSKNTTDEITIKIMPETQLANGDFIEINVTAKAIEPYEKELLATFKIYASEEFKYITNLEESSNKEYATLYIETINKDENITIKYDTTKVTLDTNNPLINTANITQNGNINSIPVQLEKESIYNMIFIKKDANSTVSLGKDIQVVE